MEALWQEFIRKRAIPKEDLRPAILDSWQRCIDSHVSPQKPQPLCLSAKQLNRRLMDHREYIEAIQPVIECVNDLIGASNYAVSFVDKDGFVLSVDGKPELKELLRTLNFRSGANWNEQNAGTTAVGITLVTGQPSHVFHSEHYCQKLQGFTCTAVPIRDPFTGKMAGILDFVAYLEDHQPPVMAMVLQMGRCLELEVYRNHRERDELFRECSAQLTLNEMERGVMILDEHESIRRANLKAVEYLGVESENLLNVRFSQLPVPSDLRDPAKSDGIFTLNGRKVRVERRPLVHQQTCIGTVVFFASVSGKEAKEPTGGQLMKASRMPIGVSPAIRKVLDIAGSAAQCSSNVMIQGETGTGKEVIARYIHEKSARRNKPFIAINCGSIPRELLGSELFGYEPGAFTGAAQKGHPSKFEIANGGTILLDEISEMPIESQVYLLRVIEERTVNRLGSLRSIPVDIRIIATSNKDLQKEVEAGRFRADLLFRINVLRIDLPPLRERKEDIPLLVNHFSESLTESPSSERAQIEPAALSALTAYEWPGNVRELRNTMERAITMAKGNTIRFENLPEHIQKARVSSDQVRTKNRGCYRDFLNVYHQYQGNISQISKALKVSRPTIYAWRKKLGID